MGIHKFRVGQLVDFNPSQAGVSSSGLRYKILRLLPQEGVESLYRIKTISESFVRTAMESELALEPATGGHGRVLQLGEQRTRRAARADL